MIGAETCVSRQLAIGIRVEVSRTNMEQTSEKPDIQKRHGVVKPQSSTGAPERVRRQGLEPRTRGSRDRLGQCRDGGVPPSGQTGRDADGADGEDLAGGAAAAAGASRGS